MGFVGFVISTFSFAMVMMGWGGAAGLSGVLGIFFFVGPVLLLLGTIFEWIMGNFFPVSTFCSEKQRLDTSLPCHQLLASNGKDMPVQGMYKC